MLLSLPCATHCHAAASNNADCSAGSAFRLSPSLSCFCCGFYYIFFPYLERKTALPPPPPQLFAPSVKERRQYRDGAPFFLRDFVQDCMWPPPSQQPWLLRVSNGHQFTVDNSLSFEFYGNSKCILLPVLPVDPPRLNCCFEVSQAAASADFLFCF